MSSTFQNVSGRLSASLRVFISGGGGDIVNSLLRLLCSIYMCVIIIPLMTYAGYGVNSTVIRQANTLSERSQYSDSPTAFHNHSVKEPKLGRSDGVRNNSKNNSDPRDSSLPISFNETNTLGDEYDADLSSLLQVQVLFRHGDRSPIDTYPKDIHRNAWPQGLGELTKIGMMQSYHLGQFLRHHYVDFLGNEYNHNELSFQSSSKRRALMSAECVAGGLFPFNASLEGMNDWPFGSWQPIPIATVPIHMDPVLQPRYTCPYVKNLYAGIMAQMTADTSLIKDKSLMFYLSYETGMDINVTSLDSFADTIFCQNAHNMSMPKWLTADIQKKVLDFQRSQPSLLPVQAKYLAGKLLKNMFTNIQMKIKDKGREKLHLFSGHDTNLHSLMSLLGVHDNLRAPYTAAFIMELHHLNGKHYIKCLYSKDRSRRAKTLIIQGCNGEMCPLTVFKELFTEYMISEEEWNEVCQDGGSSSYLIDFGNSTVPLLVAVLVLFIGLDGVLLYKACMYRHQLQGIPHQEEYALLRTDGGDSSSESETEFDVSIDRQHQMRNGHGHFPQNNNDTESDDQRAGVDISS